jgi:hypothetical protein
MSGDAHEIRSLAAKEIGTDNETAVAFGLLYVGDQLARIADLQDGDVVPRAEHDRVLKGAANLARDLTAARAELAELKPAHAEPTAAEMREHLADIDRRSRAGHDTQS